MDLRPRLRQSFSGFTKSEVEKMEQLHNDYTEQTLEDEFCKKIARLFNRSSGRAGKPVVKWTEVQSWFQKNAQQGLRRKVPLDDAKKLPVVPQTPDQNKATSNPRLPEDVKDVDLSRLEFEAKSPKDGAWYDVDTFRSHRFLDSGEAEVLVRYVGFGSDEDEWVNIRGSVRVRSVTLDPTVPKTKSRGSSGVLSGETRSSKILRCSCATDSKKIARYKRLQMSFLDQILP